MRSTRSADARFANQATVHQSSSVQAARRDLASRLHDLREDAGLTGDALSRACGWSAAKTSRIEHAKTPPSVEDIRAWCTACGADQQISDLTAALRTVEGMFVQWRRMERAGLRNANAAVLPLYERTHRFRVYASDVLPGMVQTRAYTHAVLSKLRDWRGLEDDVDATLEVRVARQQLIYNTRQRYALLIEEQLLSAFVAGAEVQREQLEYLSRVATLPHVSLGVLPARPDRSLWGLESFYMFDDAQVSVELVSGFLQLTQPTEIAQYASTFSILAQSALYGPQARDLLSAALARIG